MRTLEQTRRYEVRHEGQWVPIHWEQLDHGDRVRQYDPGVTDHYEEFTVHRHPMLHADDVRDSRNPEVRLDPVTEISPVPGDDPTSDATDFAHPAWWRAHDYTTGLFCRKVNEILDGTDKGGGSNHEPWGALRQRLVELVKERHDRLGTEEVRSGV